MAENQNLTFFPFVYALSDDYLKDYCWYCLKDDSSESENEKSQLLRCSGCKTAYFCSKRCQSIGWSDHKAECKGFAKGFEADIEIRMLGRLVWRHKQISTGLDKKDENFYLNRTSQRNVMDLCSHDQDMRADSKAWRKFEQFLQKLKNFYDKKFLTDDEIIFQLHCRNFINRHGISDRNYLNQIGKGLYLDLCWYDHSCRPNSIYTHDGFIAILRPLSNQVNLSDRSTTFYTYIDLLQSKEERRRALAGSWYFDCECARCTDDTDHLLTAIKCSDCQVPMTIFRGFRLKKSDDLVCGQCGRGMEENRLQEGIAAMRRIDSLINGDDLDSRTNDDALQFLDSLMDEISNILPWCNIFLAKLLRAAITKTESSDAERMLRYHLRAVDCMRVCYPPNHPSLANHLMSVGDFYAQLGQMQNGKLFLEEANAMFEFIFEKEHFFVKSAREQLEKISGGKP